MNTFPNFDFEKWIRRFALFVSYADTNIHDTTEKMIESEVFYIDFILKEYKDQHHSGLEDESYCLACEGSRLHIAFNGFMALLQYHYPIIHIDAIKKYVATLRPVKDNIYLTENIHQLTKDLQIPLAFNLDSTEVKITYSNDSKTTRNI